MRRVKLIRKKKTGRKPTNGFTKDHTRSLGNKGHTIAVRRSKQYARSVLLHALELHSGLDREGRDKAMLKLSKEIIEIGLGNRDPKQQMAAIKEIYDRVDGKPNQAVEVSGPERKPIQIITKDMSLTEASRLLREELGKDIEVEDDGNEDD